MEGGGTVAIGHPLKTTWLPTDLLGVVGAQLDRIGCPRFTTGSVASMVYGEPRFTNDIDIVVRLDERPAQLVGEQPPDGGLAGPGHAHDDDDHAAPPRANCTPAAASVD